MSNESGAEQPKKKYYKKKKKKPVTANPENIVQNIFTEEKKGVEVEVVIRKDKLGIIEKIIQSKSFLIIFDEMEIEVDAIGMTPERINHVLELSNQSAKENQKEIEK
jgi:hypothetical protein